MVRKVKQFQYPFVKSSEDSIVTVLPKGYVSTHCFSKVRMRIQKLPCTGLN